MSYNMLITYILLQTYIICRLVEPNIVYRRKILNNIHSVNNLIINVYILHINSMCNTIEVGFIFAF